MRTSRQDINLLKTTWIADGFGRVTSEFQPDGNERRISKLKQCSGDCRLGAPFVQVVENYHDGARISLPSVGSGFDKPY